MKLVDLSGIPDFSLKKEFKNYEDLISFYSKFDEDFYLKNNFYYEKHHIIPKCEGGLDVPENIIYLDLNHHAIAHDLRYRYYSKIGNKKLAHKNICAAKRIIGAYNRFLGYIPKEVLILGSQIKQNDIDSHRSLGLFKNTKYVTDGFITKRIKEEEIEDFLSNNPGWKIGRKFTTPSNKIWITNGFKQKYLEIQDAERFLKENNEWKRGMAPTKKHVLKDPNYSSTRGKKWVNNGINHFLVSEDKLEEYLSNGWRLGVGPKKDMTGQVAISLGNKRKFVSPDEVSKWEEQGWKRGWK